MNSRDHDRKVLSALFPLEGEPNLGEGISRPKPKARTRTYRLLVRFERANPMRIVLKAESKRHALRYAKNRWPQSVAEVIDEAA